MPENAKVSDDESARNVTEGIAIRNGHDSNGDMEKDDFGLPQKKRMFRTSQDTEADRNIPDQPTSAIEDSEKQTDVSNTYHTASSSVPSAVIHDAHGAKKLAVAPDAESGEPRQVEDVEASASKKTHDEAEQTTSPSPNVESSAVASADAIKDVTKETNTTQQRQSGAGGISEWSHQQLAPKVAEDEDEDDGEWQTMPAFAPYDIYDDDNRLIAREAQESDQEDEANKLGGAGNGYTRVQLDEDAQSATSMDDNTQYLFKEVNGTNAAGVDDEEQRDAVAQLQATKDLLTEGQRIAYVGMTRIILSLMLKEADTIKATKGSKKEINLAAEAMKMWSQKMMVRLYAHMDISTAEQIMIEQLAEHGVEPADLTPMLMQNARVKNPMAEETATTASTASLPSLGTESPPPSKNNGTPRPSTSSSSTSSSLPVAGASEQGQEAAAEPLPAYEAHSGEELPAVRTPAQLPTTRSIDIDLRWTVLCDLFLTLVADSVYDARSRVLLERAGAHLGVRWPEICRFEKRVTDALEMQQAAEKENWNEDAHRESRRRQALRKRYVVMGLATVGGSLVIGLSAGLLAPVIGAGLAAGFTTIGVAGTGGFLAGAGGAAIITSGAAASGGIIAVRAANRRTGAVKTFEYRPLHNNKRVNLIVTVSGWMTGKVDDVRLPYSTIDPIMGDIYSVLWEPEMLTSMGDTINILATEALTQGLQQLLGSTILIGLMAALQLPVVLSKLAYLIDNPWTVSLDRANSAGLILADSLIDRNLGTRPITFVGYSLGSRMIFSCLRELARKGAFGLVQNVYLFGSPIVASKDEYLKARSVVAGRFVNGYAKNDWILGYLFRLTSGGISRVAGLAPVEGIPGLENVDVTEIVPGHMSYRTAMPRLLREVGWIVESDEFSEIEDPDPENHGKRQRELINEIEEARKELDKKESKGAFGGFFSRKKRDATDRKEWETYKESKGGAEYDDGLSDHNSSSNSNNYGVLFDVDAIRAELASEQMEVRELQSTLPPMRLDYKSPEATGTPPPPPPPQSRGALRETKSYDAAIGSSSLHPTARIAARGEQPSTSSSSPQARVAGRWTGDYDYDEDDDPGGSGGMRLSFEPNASRGPSAASVPARPAPSRAASRSPSSNFGGPLPPSAPAAGSAGRAASLLRPELRSSSTLPTAAAPGDLGRNAWADDDEDDDGDEEFGQEREIQMTFA